MSGPRGGARGERPNLFSKMMGAIIFYGQMSPWVVLAGALVLTALSGFYAAGNLKIDTDTAGMISEDLPFRQRYKAFRAAFPALSDNVAIVVDADLPDRADEATEILAAKLRADPENFPRVFSPETNPFFVRNGLLYLDRGALADLSDEIAESQAFLVKLAGDPSMRGLAAVLTDAVDGIEEKEQAARIATVLDRLTAVATSVGQDKRAALSWRALIGGAQDEGTTRRVIITQPRVDFTSLSPAAGAMERIRALARESGLTPETGVTVRLTGGVVISTEELESVTTGAANAGLVSLVLVTLLLAWGIRSLRLVLAILAALIVGLVWTAGFTTLAIGHLNLVSVAFAVLFIGLGVDFGIHFALRFREERLGDDDDDGDGDGDGDPPGALRRTGRGLSGPLALCALAAAISFFSFVPTDYRGLSELGLIAGVGMFIAFTATFTIIPAFLTVFPPGAPASSPTGRKSPSLPDRRIAVAALVLGGAAAATVPFARFDLDPIKLRDPSTESVSTFRDLAATAGASPYTIELLTPSLSDAYTLAGKLRSLPEVDKTVTATDLVPTEQTEKLAMIDDLNIFLAPLRLNSPAAALNTADREKAFATLRAALARGAARDLPDLADLTAAAARLNTALAALDDGAADGANDGADDGTKQAVFEAAVFRHFSPQIDRLKLTLDAGPVALKDLPTEILHRYLAPNGHARVQVYPTENLQDPEALKRFVEAVRTIAPDATDSPVEIIEAGRAVVNSVVTAALISVFAVTLMIFLVLRSARDTLLVLIPLLLAALYTVAATVLLSMPFNFANVIVLPLLMGLGVANGIHLVSRAREESSGAAAFSTSTPRAVIFSSLTTIASFGSLAVSNHRGTASMGELLVLSIGLTLVCTLIVLPALMQLWPDEKVKS
jgi:hopanoid biosynthesis associated RND transporter like protein HpnN